MTHTNNFTDTPGKTVEQSNKLMDTQLSNLTITTIEDNKLFVRDRLPSQNTNRLDLSVVDIYNPKANDPNAYGPDRRIYPLHNQSMDEVKASAEIRFDNIDIRVLSPLDKIHPTPSKLTGDTTHIKPISSGAETLASDKTKVQPAKTDQISPSEYQIKPGDNLDKIARALAGKSASEQQIEKVKKEIAELNGWADGNRVLYPGERIKVPGDKTEAGKSTEQKQQEAREKLIKQAEEKFKGDPVKLGAFKENMKLFELRAQEDKLNPEEVTKTYKEIGRLLEARGESPLKPEQRIRLAEQIMRQAADPTIIDQGYHNTCNMATVESRMYTRNPSDAARLVTDVALTGQYVTTDGRTVRLNPSPHGESRNAKTRDGDRSHASEIFQVTTVSLHIDQENRKTNPRGQLRYEQHPTKPGSGDTGERIIDYGVKPPKVVDYHPQVYDHNLGNLRDVYTAITGKKESGIVIAYEHPGLDPSDGVTRITTEKQLMDALAKAKKEGKLPLIVAVDTNMEPFWTDSGAGRAGGSGGGHVVTITDYTPGPPPKVTIDNSWGKQADHDATKPITVKLLLQAMKDKSNTIVDLEKEVKVAKEAGHPDTYKELELARLKRLENKLTPSEYEKEIARLSKEVAKMPQSEAQLKASEKLRDSMNQLTPEAAFRILRQQKNDGMLTDLDYKDSIYLQINKMLMDRQRQKLSATWVNGGQELFEKSVKEMMESIKDFTPEEIENIRKVVKKWK